MSQAGSSSSTRDPERKPRLSIESVRRPSPRSRTVKLASPDGEREKIPKRLIVCCDGTWEDGRMKKMPSRYTNILKLSRMINPQDNRTKPAIPQVVFYQAVAGTTGYIMELIAGATSLYLCEKVQEAYAFIAHNYQPRDEIYLFGFARGAYTARMVAAFIGDIGILDKHDMDHFPEIFLNYQRRTHTKSHIEYVQLTEKLTPYLSPTSNGRSRILGDDNQFTVKVLGVFDTVGVLGLPREAGMNPDDEKLFGLPDTFLGEHIENAFQAMAIDEIRKDFDIQKFNQKELGRRKKQVLKQVWFSGCHTDIGGGYPAHDLSDITLTWMAANIEQMLSLDIRYMKSLPKPLGEWGTQTPHNPVTGIFRSRTPRTLPPLSSPSPTFPTYESIHPSVIPQRGKSAYLKALLAKNPGIVCELMPLEQEIKKLWKEEILDDSASGSRRSSVIGTVKGVIGFVNEGVTRNGSLKQCVKREKNREGSWLGAVSKEMKS